MHVILIIHMKIFFIGSCQTACAGEKRIYLFKNIYNVIVYIYVTISGTYLMEIKAFYTIQVNVFIKSAGSADNILIISEYACIYKLFQFYIIAMS